MSAEKKQYKVPCPVCGHPLNFSVLKGFDFMGEGSIILAFHCPKCNYRGFDIFPEKGAKPKRITLRVDEPRKLNVLIVRASTAKVIIPEIGADITPGPAATGFITTVEGVLLRFLEVFKGNERAESLLRPLLEGKPFTIILEDPAGASAIDSKEAIVEELD